MNLKAILIFIGIIFDCYCLKNVTVQIPKAIIKGGTGVLKCNYNLEDEPLYTMKWYRNGREFYRFTPRERHQMKTFSIPDVTLQISNKSDANNLILSNVQLEASGRYSCEVSADAPSFQTSIVSSNMDVVVLPQRRPEIEGFNSRYKVGETVTAVCKSFGSKPPANLTWSMNGEPVPPQFIKPFKVTVDDDGLYETSISTLQFVVTKRDFVGQNLRLRCTASIHDIYWKITEKSTVEDIKHKNMVLVDSNDELSFLTESSTSVTQVFHDNILLNNPGGPFDDYHSRRAASTSGQPSFLHFILIWTHVLLVIMSLILL